jgi:cobalamin biosynthesis Mg chelatase CobN
MATSFFGGSFFGGEFFNEGGDNRPRPDDGGRKRGKYGVKPLGLPPDRRKKLQAKDPLVAKRLNEAAQIEAEVASRLAREFGEETSDFAEKLARDAELGRITELERQAREERAAQLAIEAEIGLLLRKKIRTEEEEVMLLLLMAAAAE